MPTQYTRGTINSSDYYEGVTIADETALLESIRDEQGTAGQVVHLDEISSNKKLIMKGSDNGDDCYVIYETEQIIGVQYKLKITGDHDGTETTVSPAVEIDFVADGQSKLYMTSDEGAGCIFIHNPANDSQSAHFGFLDDRDLADPYAWMVGLLDIWTTGAYHAKGAINRTDWHENKLYWYSGNESFNGPQGGYTYLFDSTVALLKTQHTTINTSAFVFKPWLGTVDLKTNKPKLRSMGYQEGPDIHNSWEPIDANKAVAVHDPGSIRFARRGMSIINPAVQPTVGTKKFISGGAASQFQGFQIAA